MKVIVGLGNPGSEYDETRHNLGFLFLDSIALVQEAVFKFEKKFTAEIAEATIGETPVILVKPQTFVNKSGEAVRAITDFYKIPAEDVIVAQDDLDIPFGKNKLSIGKSSGGHNGVESIINHLKTRNFWRLKIGIATPTLVAARKHSDVEDKKAAVSKYVLSRFTPSEHDQLSQIFLEALAKLKSIV